VDGVIYAATSFRIVSLESNVPLVLLNAVSAAGGVRCVFSDDVGGAENAVSQLVAAGHRRIGFIGPAGEQPTVANRLCGFRQALAGAGVPADPEWIALAGEGTAQGGRRAVQRLLQLTTRPSAIICHDDHMAIGAYQAANDLDLDVPLDLSIIGFDDDDPTVAEALSPALTTITLPHLEMGSRAGQAILGQLGQFAMDVEGEGPSTSVPCVLNIRASVTGPTLG
jgi:LacI family transcriptional regulator